MIIGLFANLKKKKSYEFALSVRDFLQERNVLVVARHDEARELEVASLSSVPADEIDFLISMGGDGTILRLVHQFPHLEAPILGINLGHLGFMAMVPVHDIFPSLEDLLDGNFTVDERLMMEGIVPHGERCFAVNDMVVHRARNPSLIDLSLHVDGNYLNTFSADGIILSTANGSTAYSLAAGGPILTPDLNAFVITPISAHTISNRPIVLMPKDTIEVQYLSPYDPVEITHDGISRYSMSTNEVFSVGRSDRKFKMVNLNKTNYFETLREKLAWTGQVRYRELNHYEEDLGR